LVILILSYQRSIYVLYENQKLGLGKNRLSMLIILSK
jgi:hypothetical protein